MKILLISLFLPQHKASHAGGRFVFELIKELSGSHEIHLATRVDEQELPGIAELQPFCRTIHPYPYKTSAKRGLLMTLRLMLNYLGFSWNANRLISRGNYDLVQVEWVEAALLIQRGRTPMVLDAHDVITKPAERRYQQGKGIRRLLNYLAFKFIANREVSIARRFDRTLVRSAMEREYLNTLAPALPVSIIPHPAGLDIITGRMVERSNNTILFLASYKYRQTNVDAALYFYHSVLPLVRKRIPDAKFIIAGYGPPDELLSLQKQDPSVIVPGFVDDTDEYYKKASVFVAPILVGGGIIVKILDAMAAGTPVVTTSYGNEGIGAGPGRDLLIADTSEAFASMVVNVLMNGKLADQMGENGREYILRNYGKEAVFGKIRSLYEELTMK